MNKEKFISELNDSYDKLQKSYIILSRNLNKYNKALNEIEEIVNQTCKQRCTNDCLGTRKHCGYGHILNIINKTKRNT